MFVPDSFCSACWYAQSLHVNHGNSGFGLFQAFRTSKQSQEHSKRRDLPETARSLMDLLSSLELFSLSPYSLLDFSLSSSLAILSSEIILQGASISSRRTPVPTRGIQSTKGSRDLMSALPACQKVNIWLYKCFLKLQAEERRVENQHPQAEEQLLAEELFATKSRGFQIVVKHILSQTHYCKAHSRVKKHIWCWAILYLIWVPKLTGSRRTCEFETGSWATFCLPASFNGTFEDWKCHWRIAWKRNLQGGHSRQSIMSLLGTHVSVADCPWLGYWGTILAFWQLAYFSCVYGHHPSSSVHSKCIANMAAQELQAKLQSARCAMLARLLLQSVFQMLSWSIKSMMQASLSWRRQRGASLSGGIAGLPFDRYTVWPLTVYGLVFMHLPQIFLKAYMLEVSMDCMWRQWWKYALQTPDWHNHENDWCMICRRCSRNWSLPERHAGFC